jgi:hypothetical protein
MMRRVRGKHERREEKMMRRGEKMKRKRKRERREKKRKEKKGKQRGEERRERTSTGSVRIMRDKVGGTSEYSCCVVPPVALQTF